MSLCKQCISGVRHEGKTEGHFETIGGIKCYVATPTVDYPKDKVLLHFTDVFSLALNNNLLLADDFARNGFKVIAPDYTDNDPVPADGMDPGSDFDFRAWLGKHTATRALEVAHAVINDLKTQGIKKFGAVGYCLGGRTSFDLAYEHEVSVIAVSHPSLLKIPEDLHKYAEVSKAPILINSCTVDEQFPHSAQEQADAILGGGKFAPGYERTYWDGCVHGFAVRGDLSDPKVKAGKEGAFKASVDFLLKHL